MSAFRKGVIKGFKEYDPRIVLSSSYGKHDYEICALEVLLKHLELVPLLSEVDLRVEDGEYRYKRTQETLPYMFMIMRLREYAKRIKISLEQEVYDHSGCIIVLPYYNSEDFRHWLSYEIGLRISIDIEPLLDYHYYNLLNGDGYVMSYDNSPMGDSDDNHLSRVIFLEGLRSTFNKCFAERCFGLNDIKANIVNQWISTKLSGFGDQIRQKALKILDVILEPSPLPEIEYIYEAHVYEPGCSVTLLKNYFDLLKNVNQEDSKRRSLIDARVVNYILYDWFRIGPKMEKPESWNYTISHKQFLFFIAEFCDIRDKKSKNSISQQELIGLARRDFPGAFERTSATEISLLKNLNRLWHQKKCSYSYLRLELQNKFR